MTEPNNQSPTDTQNEENMDSLKYEIATLKSRLKTKDERISTLDVMLNQIMETHTAGVRAFEDLEGKLEDVIEMLRRRVPHGDILAYLKAKDINEYQFKKLW